MAALAAELDRLVEQAMLDLAADDAATGQERVDAGVLQIDDGQTDRALVSMRSR